MSIDTIVNRLATIHETIEWCEWGRDYNVSDEVIELFNKADKESAACRPMKHAVDVLREWEEQIRDGLDSL